MKRTVIVTGLAVLILGLFISEGFSSTAEIKQRMIDRLPVIKVLKVKGVVGENNSGYLEFLEGQREQAEVIEAENSDRRQVYEAIAKQQSATVEVVGVHRAAQISEKAEPGDWLEDADGRWYRKE